MASTVVSNIIAYMILSKLVKPFKEWDAYKTGIIDENGKKLKDPKTPKEKRSYTTLDRIIKNVKVILEKYISKSRLVVLLSAIYLLKDSVELAARDSLIEEAAEEYEHLKPTVKIALENLVNLSEVLEKQDKTIWIPSKISESFEDELIKTMTLVELAIRDKDETKVLEENLASTMTTSGAFWSITTDDCFDPKFFKRDPYINQRDKSPKQAISDIEKIDRQNKFFKPNDLDKVLNTQAKDRHNDFKSVDPSDSTVEPDGFHNGLPYFNVNSEEEFLSFTKGRKEYRFWKQHTTNSKISKWTRKNPYKDFIVRHKDKFIKVDRSKAYDGE